MFEHKLDINNLDQLQKHLEFVKKMIQMKSDTDFQDYIKQKVLEVADKVTNERLVGGTTNDDAIGLYKSSHKIRDFEQGFILYNDAAIPANVNGIQNDIENYPNEMFCVALAFEYGVGILGEITGSDNAWAYNVQGYNFGWYLPQSVTGEVGIQTAGYMGFEIYRHIAEEVKTKLNKWVKEYYKKEVK